MDISGEMDRLRQWIGGQYVVRDEDSDPSKCVYKPFRIDDVVALDGNFYVLLTHAISGQKKIHRVHAIIDEPLFSSLDAAQTAAREQQAEDDAAAQREAA